MQSGGGAGRHERHGRDKNCDDEMTYLVLSAPVPKNGRIGNSTGEIDGSAQHW